MTPCACGCGKALTTRQSGRGLRNACYKRLQRAGQLPPKAPLKCACSGGKRCLWCRNRDASRKYAQKKSAMSA